MRYSKSRIELFEPGQNVSLWLHRLNTVRIMQGWSNADAIREASMLMGDIALTWFLTHCNQLTPWPDFEYGMRKRFGDSEQTIIARVQHRKQRENESVQSYIDDMNMMFAQSAFPDVVKRNLLIDNMKPSLRQQILSSIPTTEQVIENALFLEETAATVTSEKIRCWEQQSSNSKLSPIDRITKAMDKMTLALSGSFDRQYEYSRDSLDRSPAPHSKFRAGPVQCWTCQGYGHEAADCDSIPRPSNDARANLLESHYHRYNNTLDSDDCTPTTPEAQEYAKRLESREWRQRRHQVRPWISQAASRGVAECCMVVSGSDTAQTQATCIEPAYTAITSRATSAEDKDLECVPDDKASMTSALQTEMQPATHLILAQAKPDTAHIPEVVLQPEVTEAKSRTQSRKQMQGYASPFSFTFSKPTKRSRASSSTALEPNTAQTNCTQTDEVQKTALYVASKLQEPACEAAVAVQLAKHAEKSPDETPHLTETSTSGDAQTVMMSFVDNTIDSKLSCIKPYVDYESPSVLTEYVSVDSPVCLVGKASPVATVFTEILPKPPEAFVFATEAQSESVPTPVQSCKELPDFVGKGDRILPAAAQPDSGMLLSQNSHVKLTDMHQYTTEPGDSTLTAKIDLQEWPLSCMSQNCLSNTAAAGNSLPTVLGGLHYMSKDPDDLGPFALLSQNNAMKTLTGPQDRLHDHGQYSGAQPLWTQDNPTRTDGNATTARGDMIMAAVLPSRIALQTLPGMRYITSTSVSRSLVMHSMIRGPTFPPLYLVSSNTGLKRQYSVYFSKLGNRPHSKHYADSMILR